MFTKCSGHSHFDKLYSVVNVSTKICWYRWLVLMHTINVWIYIWEIHTKTYSLKVCDFQSIYANTSNSFFLYTSNTQLCSVPLLKTYSIHSVLNINNKTFERNYAFIYASKLLKSVLYSSTQVQSWSNIVFTHLAFKFIHVAYRVAKRLIAAMFIFIFFS